MLGSHPRVAVHDFHVRRRSSDIGGGVKKVPNMVHSMESNRAMVAEHRLMEEDFRSYRAIVHNWMRAQWRNLPKNELKAMYKKNNKIAAKVLDLNYDQLKQKNEAESASLCTTLSTYVSTLPGPPGYLYQRHNDNQKQAQHLQNLQEAEAKEEDRSAMKLPLLEIDDPFGRRVHIIDCARESRACQRDILSHDVTGVIVPGIPERVMVYNEPDSVPCHLTTENLIFSLAERTRFAAVYMARVKRTPRGSIVSTVSNTNIRL